MTDNSTRSQISEKTIIKTLLAKEEILSTNIHNSVGEIMRLGYPSERANRELKSLIEHLRYQIDDLEEYINVGR